MKHARDVSNEELYGKYTISGDIYYDKARYGVFTRRSLLNDEVLAYFAPSAMWYVRENSFVIKKASLMGKEACELPTILKSQTSGEILVFYKKYEIHWSIKMKMSPCEEQCNVYINNESQIKVLHGSMISANDELVCYYNTWGIIEPSQVYVIINHNYGQVNIDKSIKKSKVRRVIVRKNNKTRLHTRIKRKRKIVKNIQENHDELIHLPCLNHNLEKLTLNELEVVVEEAYHRSLELCSDLGNLVPYLQYQAEEEDYLVDPVFPHLGNIRHLTY